MTAAAEQEYERAAKYRDLISTVEQLQEKQRMAGVEGDDADVFGYHYENGMLAVNLFHMRGGKVVDRREFFWEDLPEFGTDRPPTSGPWQRHDGATGVPPVERLADVVQSDQTQRMPGCAAVKPAPPCR